MTFRKLTAGEIDCRIAQITKDGSLMLLLYKDARVDQKLLDEKFGIFGWQRKHEVIGGNLYCTVSVKNPDTGEWVSKQDVGVESNTEKEKGQASDSFKRACFNLGIGRELYSAPQIWINKGNYNDNGKGGTYDKFIVTEIGYDDNGNINKLAIKNDKLKRVVFTYGDVTSRAIQPAEIAKSAQQEKRESVEKAKINEAEVKRLLDQCEKDGVNPAYINGLCEVADLSELTKKQYVWIVTNWTKEVVNGMQGAN